MTDAAQAGKRSHQIPRLSVPEFLTEEIRIELRRAALQARSTAVRIHGGGGFRARRSQRVYQQFLAGSFVALIIAPMAYIGAYLWAMPPQYTTESRFTVVTQDAPTRSFLSGLIGSENSGEAYLMAFVESNNIIAILSETDPDLIGRSGVLRENPVMSRIMGPVPSLERKLELWSDHVMADRQSLTGTIELSVAALTAEASLELHERIFDLTEQHINLVSERRRTAQVMEASAALEEARAVLRETIADLQRVRQKYNMIDPKLEATQRTSLIYQLEQQQADYRQRLGVLQERSFENPQIAQMEAQITALENQKKALRQSIAGSIAGSDATVAEAAAEMGLIEADVIIARDQVAQRMFELSEARQTASRQGIFLQRIVSPVLPQTPQSAPRILYGLLALGGAIAIWLIMAAIGALIRDYAR